MATGVYSWSRDDKLRYGVSLVPYVAAVVGAAWILGNRSIWLVVGYVALFLVTNLFQAGACTGCPYRGSYCPPIFGVYLGNLLSVALYKNREYDPDFIHRHAKFGEVAVTFFLLFPAFWLFDQRWYFAAVYFVLLALHVALFMPTQCEKCSYNGTCPGGTLWVKCRGALRG